MKQADADLLLKQIKTIILNKPVTEELKSTSTELLDLQEAISYLADCLSEANEFLKNVSVGNLEVTAPSRHNFLASSLKALHAGLRHLTWQANQVAHGDYKQKVSFLGDFSDSFNQMVMQLEERENGLKSQAAALNQSMNLMIAIMDGMNDWVIVTEMSTGNILYSNHASDAHFYDTETNQLFCGATHCALLEHLRAYVDADAQTQFEFSCDINGKTLRVQTFAVQWNEKQGYVHFISDVTEVEVEKKQLENLAFKDELTGLYNRRHGLQTLRRLVMEQQEFSVCLLDLDGLKSVNDQFGHLMGDDFITAVTGAMQQLGNDACTMCRVGGDEFIIIAEGASEAEAYGLLYHLDEKLAGMQRPYPIAVSYGVLHIASTMKLSPEAVLKQVDEKMYIAKNKKKRLRI